MFEKLLLSLFVHRRSTAPLAELIELNFARHQLLVFARPIVDALAFAALQLYKAVLGHAKGLYPTRLFCAIEALFNCPCFYNRHVPVSV